eukprot:1177962-Prorocentrum_minimum.AAC.2
MTLRDRILIRKMRINTLHGRVNAQNHPSACGQRFATRSCIIAKSRLNHATQTAVVARVSRTQDKECIGLETNGISGLLRPYPWAVSLGAPNAQRAGASSKNFRSLKRVWWRNELQDRSGESLNARTQLTLRGTLVNPFGCAKKLLPVG